MEKKVRKLLDFYHAQKRMPTYTEMVTLFDYKTKSAAHYFISKLINEGIILKDSAGHLIPKSLDSIKKLGIVEAGFPTPSEEELVDTLGLDDYLVENKEATYMLTVKGDSMKDAGIIEGDLVLVERGKTPNPGDIVIARIDGGYTMKYYRQKRNGVYLEAANPNYEPIYPEQDLAIEAVVRAVIRKY